MPTIQAHLIKKLEKLPPQRLAEVEDFVEFLARREERMLAGEKLGNLLAQLDAVDLPYPTDEEIEGEIQQVRREGVASRG